MTEIVKLIDTTWEEIQETIDIYSQKKAALLEKNTALSGTEEKPILNATLIFILP